MLIIKIETPPQNHRTEQKSSVTQSLWENNDLMDVLMIFFLCILEYTIYFTDLELYGFDS
jgi:hypothetical protein